MPSLRSMLLLVPLAASNLANGQPTSNEDNIVRRNDVFESRRAVSEQRQGIVGVGCDAIARAVEESVFKRYLRRRQDSNTTVGVTLTNIVTATVSLPIGGSSSSSSSSSSQAPPPSSDQPSSSSPVVADPTSDPATSDPPSSSAVQPTTTAALPSSTTFAVIDSAGSVVTSVPNAATISNVVFTSPTPGGVYTGTESDGNVLVVTYTPDGGTVSEVRLLTTTLPNGSVTQITSYATVGAPANPTGESSNSQPNGDEPQLQSGAALPSTWYAAELAVMFGAAVGAAAIML